MKNPFRIRFHSFMGIVLCMPTCMVVADDRGPLDQDFQVSLGGFFVSTDTQLRLDGDSGLTGTDIDWERDLNFEDKDRFRVDAFWRFAKHHKVRFMYFENNRSSSQTLSRQINFGDVSFPVNAVVEAELNTQIIELAYEYAFMRRDTLELSGSIGIHNVKASAALRGTLTAGGGGGTAQGQDEASLNGPLPVIGAHVLWNMGGNLYLEGLAQFFYLEYQDTDGRITDFKIGVTWFPTKHVGIGIGYNDFVTTVDLDKNMFDGRLRMSYGGALLYLTAGF